MFARELGAGDATARTRRQTAPRKQRGGHHQRSPSAPLLALGGYRLRHRRVKGAGCSPSWTGPMVVDTLASLLRKRHPTWEHVDDLRTMKSSLGGSWYLSPRRHVVELIGFSVLFTTTFLWTYGLALQPGGRIDAALQEGLLSARHHSTDKLWAGLLAGSLCVVSIHKYLRGGGLFLLQPCHVSATALIWVLLADPKAALPHVAFNILISAQWGGWMAVLFPDLRDYKLPCEIENFWLEHGLVCGLPLLLIATGRFIVFPLDVMFTTAAFLFNGAFHSVVLHAVALLSGFNINYQINPPPVRVVERLGKNYKAIMYLFTWLVTLATRYIAVEALLQLTKGLR